MKRLAQNLLRLNPSVAARTCALPRVTPFQMATIPAFRFSTGKEESDFDGHDDFKAESKVGGSELDSKIMEWVSGNDVCLFMKGTRKMPRCGFSNYVV